jgi:hypothetical protein
MMGRACFADTGEVRRQIDMIGMMNAGCVRKPPATDLPLPQPAPDSGEELTNDHMIAFEWPNIIGWLF